MKRIYILDARLIDGVFGGAQQVVIGMANGISQLDATDEEFRFLVYEGEHAWLDPYLGRSRLLVGPPIRSALRRWVKGRIRLPAVVVAMLNSRRPELKMRSFVSDGLIEKAGASVIHFTTQQAFDTSVPSIYQPHDLQHLHYPEFFSAEQYGIREFFYRDSCRKAALVAAMTAWGKRDLMEHLGLPAGKIIVVPWAPVVDAYPTPSTLDIARIGQLHQLPEAFLYYPAQAAPHKNHLGLFEALASLNRAGLRIPVVLTGVESNYTRTLMEKAALLGVKEQTHFLGYRSPLEISAFYRLARALVFPSFFEGWGLPVTEAFSVGLPVIASRSTCLPDLVGDAAVLFDPSNISELVDGIKSVWTNEVLRKELARKGHVRAAAFSWKRTAEIFRSHYRRLSGAELTVDDERYLAESMT